MSRSRVPKNILASLDLINAVKDEDEKEVERLLQISDPERKPKLDFHDSEALTTAIRKRNIPITRLLINAGANLQADESRLFFDYNECGSEALFEFFKFLLPIYAQKGYREDIGTGFYHAYQMSCQKIIELYLSLNVLTPEQFKENTVMFMEESNFNLFTLMTEQEQFKNIANEIFWKAMNSESDKEAYAETILRYDISQIYDQSPDLYINPDQYGDIFMKAARNGYLVILTNLQQLGFIMTHDQYLEAIIAANENPSQEIIDNTIAVINEIWEQQHNDAYESENEFFDSEDERENAMIPQRRQEALQQEEINEAIRQARIEELKSGIEEKEENINPYITEHCTNKRNFHGDPLEPENLIVFLIENRSLWETPSEEDKGDAPSRGECYERKEFLTYYSSISDEERPCVWIGPPAPSIYTSPDGQVTRGAKDLSQPVYKLAYSGIWIDKDTMQQILERTDSILTIQLYKKEKVSIGTSFGISQLHGQWGGEWAPVQRGHVIDAIKVPEENAEPDERFDLYTWGNIS